MILPPTLKSKLVNLFCQYPVETAYLFGSRALNTANHHSDVDIGIVCSKKVSKEKRSDLRLKLIADLNKILKKEVDVIIFNDLKSLFFKYVIISEGQLLYEKSESNRVDLECRTLSEYFDFAPFLDLYNRHYVKNNLQ